MMVLGEVKGTALTPRFTGTGFRSVAIPLHFQGNKPPSDIFNDENDDAFWDMLHRRREENPLLNGELRQWSLLELKETATADNPDYVDAKIELALRHVHGILGAPRDLKKAETYYRDAAKNGDARGAYYLGIYLLHEKPREQRGFFKNLVEILTTIRYATPDQVEAYGWISLAASQTHRPTEEVSNAQHELRQLRAWFPKLDRLKGEARAAKLKQQFAK